MTELLGKKLGMTNLFSAGGEALPVTVVEAGPCVVVQKKTRDKEGYDAVQVGYQPVSEKRISKPGKKKPYRFLREIRNAGDGTLEVGQLLTIEGFFTVGEKVHVTGTSKGRGFQGVIKRHGKAGGPASHGSRFHRSTGSIGQRTSPGEVFKNMKLPGHLGSVRVTVKNLEIVEVRAKENLLFLRGAVPGAKNGLLRIRKAV